MECNKHKVSCLNHFVTFVHKQIKYRSSKSFSLYIKYAIACVFNKYLDNIYFYEIKRKFPFVNDFGLKQTSGLIKYFIGIKFYNSDENTQKLIYKANLGYS